VSGIDTAVLLAAGQGSRLRGVAASKPLCTVGGVALIDHALGGLAAAGIARAIVVLGYEGDAIAEHIAALDLPIMVETVWTRDWTLPNGVSVLAAADAMAGRPALMAMCDHIVAPALYRRMADQGTGGGVRLGIDRRLGHPWVDPEDVTCVATTGERIVAIGKGLEPHDAYDTGVFVIGAPFLDALSSIEAPSITEGVRALATRDLAFTADCSDLDWIDVDDAPALAKAEAWLAGR
jgi:1L-myo-inositol 1-phosphate cytidylyltransferase